MTWQRKLQKLRHLSADELRIRVRGFLRQRSERRCYERPSGGHKVSRGAAPRRIAGQAARLVPGTQADNLTRLRENHAEFYAGLKAQTLRHADSVLGGKWNSLGHRFDLGEGVDWQFDPRSDFRWPRGFYADIPIYDAGDSVDVKYVWELGRQQYVFALAGGWLLDGRSEFAGHARTIMLSWIAKNPLYEGVHWTSALEVAVRSISWIWSLAALEQWDGWNADDLASIAASLAEHADYLLHHLSYYSSPYNHLVGEATGLLLIGSVLDDHPEAERWRALGRSVLVEHGPRQFYDDGFSVEQATGYHFFTVGFLSMAIVAARSRNEPLHELEPVVQRAFRAGAVFRQPDGRWPAIGDVDSARSIPVPHEEFWDFNSLCSLGAALFDDPELKTSQTGTEAYWLLGSDAVAALENMPQHAESRNIVLADAGYWIAAEGNEWCVLDAGPLAGGLHADATPSTAHGHLDVLQVLYCHDNRPVLSDSGMPYYSGDRRWINHFRGTAAHNTIEIDGIAAARDVGHLAWSHVQYETQLSGSSAARCEARGRLRFPNGVAIDRYVLMLPEVGLWIADLVSLDEPRQIRWMWHMGADVKQVSDPPILASARNVLLASWTNAKWHDTSLVRCEPDSPLAWHSAGYGRIGEGACLIEEVSGVVNGLKVTSIGPELTPFQFVIGGEEISQGWTDSLEGIIEVPSGDAVWRIAQKRLEKSAC